MSIKLYTGISGSGKTYEVVSNVILNAYRFGRRVVSNIAGLNREAFDKVLLATGATPPFGEIVCVTHDQVSQPDFFPRDDDAKTGRVTVVKGGDVVVLDEIWRFWPATGKLLDTHLNFFRMHRQLIDPETKQTCDIALITQLVSDVNRAIRGNIEEVYSMTKATSLGLSKRYRVDIYATAASRAKISKQLFKTYDPQYFPLYQSHATGGGGGIEENIDKRGNILSGKLFVLILPVLLLVVLGAYWYLYRFFHPSPQVFENTHAAVSGRAGSIAPGTAPKPVIQAPALRLIGYYSLATRAVAVVQDESGVIRYIDHPAIAGIGSLSQSMASLHAETFSKPLPAAARPGM